ncbi:MAG: ATP-binding protein [Saprospiraceae bacterium]|nr:ATP-binding protein [Saprospiraceae bacterium]
MPPTLTAILSYLSELAHWRIAPYFAEKGEKKNNMPQPKAVGGDSPLALFLQQNPLTADEYAILAIGLVPHVQPHFFDDLMRKFMPQGGDFYQIGGGRSTHFRGFLPTGETALFLLAGEDLERRFEVQQIFSPDHFFSKKKILWLEEVSTGEPAMSGRVVLSPEYVDLFTTGKIVRPRFSTSFPAELVETSLDWDDLVLNTQTISQVQELLTWLRHGGTLFHEYGLGKRIKPGYRTLFWGPPGTGKTLTAGLLGKHSERDVYKIDLSMVVSKFIGETEKNLANLFDRAENKDWILFFDEADALFGKRTGIRDAHDKYANQEVSYLLQRVETYNGLVILASNFKSNIDEAFVRRFQSIIHFPMPKASERQLLWQKAFPEKMSLNDLNINALAQKYELTGAAILNIVQYACLRTLERGENDISDVDIREGVVREFSKEGKIIG